MFGALKRLFSFKNFLTIFVTFGQNNTHLDVSDIEVALLKTGEQFPSLTELNMINDLYSVTNPLGSDKIEVNLKLRDALAPHLHIALTDPCSAETNDDPKQKARNDQREFFRAAADVLCPYPASCAYDRERMLAAQWKKIVEASRIPATLTSSQQCQPTAVSQVYTQQFNSRTVPKNQTTEKIDLSDVGIATVGAIVVGSAAHKLRNKIREFQNQRRRA